MTRISSVETVLFSLAYVLKQVLSLEAALETINLSTVLPLLNLHNAGFFGLLYFDQLVILQAESAIAALNCSGGHSGLTAYQVYFSRSNPINTLNFSSPKPKDLLPKHWV
nr:hypothetical protein Iba_chr06fCG6670 [Ipomoea batatas]